MGHLAARKSRSRNTIDAPAIGATVLAGGKISQLPRELAIEWVGVAKITRYANNPRRNDKAVADVAASLVAYGWEQPIVVDRDGIIVVGDTRYLAALQLQQSHVPIYRATHLTTAQAKAYRLADNKVGERAEWDLPRLAAEFQQLQELGSDLGLTGFRDFELGPIMAADFSPASVSGGASGPSSAAGGGSDDDDDSANVVRFSEKQIVVVLSAAEKYRREQKRPTLSLPEVLTRICQMIAGI